MEGMSDDNEGGWGKEMGSDVERVRVVEVVVVALVAAVLVDVNAVVNT